MRFLNIIILSIIPIIIIYFLPISIKENIINIIDLIPISNFYKKILLFILTISCSNNKKNINKSSKINKNNVTQLQKKIVASNQKWKCNYCHNLLDYTYEIDHITPLFKGGTNNISNLQALCRTCHGRKSLIENNNIIT